MINQLGPDDKAILILFSSSTIQKLSSTTLEAVNKTSLKNFVQNNLNFSGKVDFGSLVEKTYNILQATQGVSSTSSRPIVVNLLTLGPEVDVDISNLPSSIANRDSPFLAVWNIYNIGI